MVPKDSADTLCLGLLKRLLEGGFTINKEEALKYGKCFTLLLEMGGAVRYEDGFNVLPEGCLMLLEYAVERRIKLEEFLRSINWRGFERIILEVFRLHGFKASGHFRFRLEKTIREIDVLVEAPTFLISIDCKQWVRRNYNIRRACRLQFERSKLLSEYLKKEGELRKGIYPVVITFLDSKTRALDGCLVLPVWKIGEVAENPEVLRILLKPVS